MQLRRPGGLPTSLAVDPQVAGFLRGCDGTRTLDELGRKLAAEVKVDAEQVRQQCCAVVRKLVERRLALL
jgi:ribosome-associated toxin RatA of RatAB toxin-antitoxin module